MILVMILGPIVGWFSLTEYGVQSLGTCPLTGTYGVLGTVSQHILSPKQTIGNGGCQVLGLCFEVGAVFCQSYPTSNPGSCRLLTQLSRAA